jgi:hypothetical protein
MDESNDALRLDYEQTTELMRTLTDIRFKLLAFVPTIAGASVGFMGSGHSARHERGICLGYGAALAGWTYLFVWGRSAHWTSAARGRSAPSSA